MHHGLTGSTRSGALQFLEAIAESLNQLSEFLGIAFFGGCFGNFAPIGFGQFRTIRVAVVSHCSNLSVVGVDQLLISFVSSPAMPSNSPMWSISAMSTNS